MSSNSKTHSTSTKHKSYDKTLIGCPRCHQVGRLIARRTPHNTYYYVYHSRNKMCYVGAREYEYVTRLHDFELRGAHDNQRYTDYLTLIVELLAERVKDNAKLRDEYVKHIADAYIEITELIVELYNDPSIDESTRKHIARALARALEIAIKAEVVKA